MSRAVGLSVALLVATGTGCGDHPGPPPPLSEAVLLTQLRALPGVSVEVASFPDDGPRPTDGLHYYILQFRQPVDHDDPSLGTFVQQVRLLHRDERAATPLVVSTMGYADLSGYKPVELTKLLTANQISIEHRFFGASRPATVDWSKLTIAQMAADEHAILAALRGIYRGAVITTGGSKGGMAAMFHRRLYPDDVDGTVGYVTPLSVGTSDATYQAALDARDTTPCRQAVRAAAIAMISTHRDELVAKARAQPMHTYTRVLVEPAVEAAIASLEWGFWQHKGSAACGSVPAAGASVDELFAFLEQVSSVAEYSDSTLGAYEPYVYQSHTQLGYPAEEPSFLEDMDLLQFGDADYVGELPLDVVPGGDDHRGPHARGPGRGGDDEVPVLPFDSAAMPDIASYFASHGDRVLLIYGEADPWTARSIALGASVDGGVFVQPAGNHYSSIQMLAEIDRARALTLLAAWTDVDVEQIRTAATFAPEDPEPESRGLARRPGK